MNISVAAYSYLLQSKKTCTNELSPTQMFAKRKMQTNRSFSIVSSSFVTSQTFDLIKLLYSDDRKLQKSFFSN